MPTQQTKRYYAIANLLLWAGTSYLWINLMFNNPYSIRATVSPQILIMFNVSMLAMLFSVFYSPRILAVLACISLLPIGLYLMLYMNRYSLIGAFNIISLLLVGFSLSSTDDAEQKDTVDSRPIAAARNR